MFEQMKFNPVKTPICYIPTGIFALDIKGGIRDNDFVVIAANTGSGKSWVALWMALNAAKAGFKTALIDYENGSDTVDERLKIFYSIDSKKLQENGLLNFYCAPKNEGKVIKSLIFAEKNSHEHWVLRKLEQIENFIIASKPKLLIIDQFNCLIRGLSGFRIPQITAVISDGLHKLAMEYHCAIVVLEQLNKEKLNGVRPTERDIKGGASLIHKATKIITLYKFAKEQSHKLMVKNAPQINLNQFLEVIVNKDRYGDMLERINVVKIDHGIFQPLHLENSEYMDFVFCMGIK